MSSTDRKWDDGPFRAHERSNLRQTDSEWRDFRTELERRKWLRKKIFVLLGIAGTVILFASQSEKYIQAAGRALLAAWGAL